VQHIEEFEFLTVPHQDVLRDGRLDIYPWLQGTEYIEIRVGATSTRIQAKGYVGLIPINDRLILEVVPRVPLSIPRIMEVSGESPVQLLHSFRSYATEGAMYPSLAAVYAAGLRLAVEEILQNGLLKVYERREEVTSFPHGRIDLGRTTTQQTARGVQHKATISYFRRTVDNSVNQCLLYAAWRLTQYVSTLQASGMDGRHRRLGQDLNAVWQHLGGVSLDRSEGFLGDPFVTGARTLPPLRAYYRPALDLALAITGRRAVVVESSGSSVRLPSLLVDMSTVFEAYVRQVLVLAQRANRWPLEVLDGNILAPEGGGSQLLHSGRYVKATPDIVFRRRPGAPGPQHPLLVEVKYKPALDVPRRGDLNQVISYGMAFRAPAVVIAAPKAKGTAGPRAGLSWIGNVESLDIYQYVLDLSGDLPAAEREFAAVLEQVAVTVV